MPDTSLLSSSLLSTLTSGVRMPAMKMSGACSLFQTNSEPGACEWLVVMTSGLNVLVSDMESRSVMENIEQLRERVIGVREESLVQTLDLLLFGRGFDRWVFKDCIKK